MGSFPEYPLIKRIGTHGLLRSGIPVRKLGSASPRLDDGTTGHGPDPIPLIPRLPLPPEHRGIDTYNTYDKVNAQNNLAAMTASSLQTISATRHDSPRPTRDRLRSDRIYLRAIVDNCIDFRSHRGRLRLISGTGRRRDFRHTGVKNTGACLSRPYKAEWPTWTQPTLCGRLFCCYTKQAMQTISAVAMACVFCAPAGSGVGCGPTLLGHRMAHPRIEEFDRLTRPDGSASALGYRMPGEFERLSCVWLSPPENPETWPGCLDKAQQQFADWVGLLKQAVAVRTTTESAIPTNDSWIRDFGPIFVVCDEPEGCGPKTLPASQPDNLPGQLPMQLPGTHPGTLPGALSGAHPGAHPGGVACHDFHFNTWGGKYEVRDLDDVVPQHIARGLGMPIWVHDFVLEGGSIDVNGRGTVMTTEQCLLNPNRNPGLSREQIEAKLHETLGTRHVIWLPGGIEGDDTDGHIDDVARFISPDTVAVVSAPVDHPDYEVTRANVRALRGATDQDGGPLQIVEIPVPKTLAYDYPDGRAVVPASYANFLIANRRVFVPTYGQAADDRALGLLDAAMPGYLVVPVRAEHLVVGLGALHCLSQQQPAESV